MSGENKVDPSSEPELEEELSEYNKPSTESVVVPFSERAEDGEHLEEGSLVISVKSGEKVKLDYNSK